MAEWKEYKLGDICDLLDCLHKTPKYSEDGFPMVRVTDVKNGYLETMNCLKVNEDVFNAFSKNYQPKNGDIVFTRVGSYGLSALVKRNERFCIGQNTSLIIPKKIYPKFAFYYLISSDARQQIDGLVGGSTQPTISMQSIRKIVFPFPPLSEQKAIASVLSSLDDKIDLLHRQNKTLEAMAETLFRQWFVVEAQEDWEDILLGDIADINPTYKLKKGEVASYLEMSNVSNSTFNPSGWTKREFSSGMKFQNGDTLLARITPCLENGKTCFVTFLDEDEIGWGSTEYIVIRMKQPFHPFISYIIARDKDFREFAISTMSGSSGRQRASANVIKEFDLKLPPAPIIEELNNHLAGIVPKLEINSNQIHTLEKLRDTLLPKLMSGEVRVEL
ncbi:restriction endonuclease subunit S [Desulfobacter postgatei]|uniref:restriction endonuclease subunit S n=1 Tax=Desulfobacter postgatei TaxID=2293 RepID=UPI00259B0416|nr:restriction endonuclease subunit S [uncultured Desulfobacter sp.]